jgi:Putative transposase/Transposase zinc-binding domain
MSERPALEVGDIIRAHGQAFLDAQGQRLSAQQRRVLHALESCRTAVLGGHVEACDACGVVRVSYNSCRNRHCPRCRGGARAAWLQREATSLLATEYYHVVFTLPAEIAAVALQNPAVVYNLLFQAASATLKEVAAAPKHLGAEVGILAVLHTWGQNLHHHPHLHCVVSGGGLSCNEQGVVSESPRWVSCRAGFFLPVQVLSRVYRGKFLALLRQAFAGGALSFHGQLTALAEPEAFASWLRPLFQAEWVVYAKPPCGGAEQVLKYLAAYTHGVAINNHRLLSLEDGEVTFLWKDYAHGGKQRTMTLSAEEFLRRFLWHVLPRGFVRIRHYGLLSNRVRAAKLALCRQLLGTVLLQSVVVLSLSVEQRCPACGVGILRVIEILPRGEPWRAGTEVCGCDSS